MMSTNPSHYFATLFLTMFFIEDNNNNNKYYIHNFDNTIETKTENTQIMYRGQKYAISTFLAQKKTCDDKPKFNPKSAVLQL